MTTGHATASCCGLFEIDWQIPCAKGDGIADMFRIVGGVRLMACPAGSTLYRLIDMHEMKILVPIAKTGQSGREFLLGDGLLVTHETERVVARLVRGIEKLREKFPQHSEIIGAMGIMTGRAVFLSNGAMMVLVLFQICLHID